MRAALLRFLGVAAFAGLGSIAPIAPIAATCAGAGPNHAAIVVEHGNGTVLTRCVSFSSGSISGEQLLRLSGIEFATQTFGGFGDAICQLDSEPKQYADCLGKDSYWAYFVARKGGGWQFSSTGISNESLRDGDAEGFRYEPASGSPVAPPSPAGVCRVAAPTPAPTKAPVAPPSPPPPAPTSAPPARSSQRPPVVAVPSATPPAATASASPSLSASETTSDLVAGLAASPPAAGSAGGTGAIGPGGGGGSGSNGPDPGVVAAGFAAVALAGLVIVRATRRPR